VVVYQQGNRRRRSILILIVVTAVALITLDVRESGPISGLRDGTRDVFEPITSGVETVFSPIGDYVDGVVHSASLKDENARLRDRLDETEGKQAKAQAAIAENKRLKQILDIPYVEEGDAVAAQVVGGAPGNFEFTVQIDVGSNSGVVRDMAVVTGAGLVGKISEAASKRSTVNLLRDPDSGVEVSLAGGATGILNGRGDNEFLKLIGIDPSVEVKKGDEVATAGGVTSVFPGGIPVGRVARVENNRGAVEQDILVDPKVDFSRLSLVKVLPAPTR
jgi:rod shape-determining protein MreC